MELIDQNSEPRCFAIAFRSFQNHQVLEEPQEIEDRKQDCDRSSVKLKRRAYVRRDCSNSKRLRCIPSRIRLSTAPLRGVVYGTKSPAISASLTTLDRAEKVGNTLSRRFDSTFRERTIRV